MLEVYDRQLVTADDSELKVYGQAKFQIEFGKRCTHQLLVAEISYEGIIGIDFLLDHENCFQS